MYSPYGIVFVVAVSWSFGNDLARNDVRFTVDNIFSSYANNCKNNFLVLGEGQTDYINGSVDIAEKKFSINFGKKIERFTWVCITVLIIVIYLLTKQK